MMLFEAALQDYEKQTGIALAEHPLAKLLENCGSVESVTAVLHDQIHDFRNFRRKDRVMGLLKNTVSFLSELSAATDIGQTVCL